MAFLWAAFTIICLIFLYCFNRLTSTTTYRFLSEELTKTDQTNTNLVDPTLEQSLEGKPKALNYSEAFREVRSESLLLFFSFFIAFIVYPGVFFTAIVRKKPRKFPFTTSPVGRINF